MNMFHYRISGQHHTTRLDQYVADIESEGHAVVVSTVSGGSAQDIKDWVTDGYNAGSDGFFFVGDITAAWAEVSGSQFPFDLFFMDIDGNWQDNNSDGIYEIHTAGAGDMAPEIFLGRLYVHSHTYDSEANMVNGYFAKTHDYRLYQLTQPWRGLEYVEEDWYDMAVNMDGLQVYSNDRYGGWMQDAYVADVFLLNGWNQLLCKVSQGGGDFQFSARFADPTNETFPDLKYQINDPASHPAEAEINARERLSTMFRRRDLSAASLGRFGTECRPSKQSRKSSILPISSGRFTASSGVHSRCTNSTSLFGRSLQVEAK